MNKHPKHNSCELSICWGGLLSLEVDQLTENITDLFFIPPLLKLYTS